MNKQLINDVFNDMETGRFEKAGKNISDDFSTTLIGKKVNKEAYLHSYQALLQGIPDLKLKVQDVSWEGTHGKAKLLISGTHTKLIPPVMEGFKSIEPTGKKLDGLATDIEIKVEGDKIQTIYYVDANQGVLAGLLNRLGMDYTGFQQN